jgi:DNA-binding transcriptional LysR family regulator
VKLAWLDALLAVIDEGTFSEAALALGLSQAAVSYSLGELERELGGRVLERGRFGARPTELGLRVAEHARRIRQLTNAIGQEAAAAGELTGTVRIAAYRSVAARLMPAIMTELRRRHPKLSLSLVEVLDDTLVRQALREGRADAGFLEFPPGGEFLGWALMRDPFVALVPERKGEQRWDEIYDHPFICYADSGCATFIKGYLKQLDPPIVPSHYVAEDTTIIGMIAQGLGAALVPQLVFDHLPEGVARLPLERPLEREISVALPDEGLRQPAVRAFLAAVRAFYPDSGIPPLALPGGVASDA